MPLKLDLSPDGVNFLSSWEGFKAKAYLDSAGILTIGYGTRIDLLPEPLKTQVSAPSFRATTEVAQKWLLKQVQADINLLQTLAIGSLHQHQIDAIICFTYNIGFEAFKKSTVYSQIVFRDTNLEAWKLFNKVDGQIVDGLTRRRKSELRLFIYGDYLIDLYR